MDVPNISETGGNVHLWNVGAKRKHRIQIKGIWKEGTKKNLRTHQRKPPKKVTTVASRQ
jgi:hypothetical protein